jgi:small-conductance mechanosensitive channel
MDWAALREEIALVLQIELFEIGTTQVTIGTVVIGGLIAVSAVLIAHWVQRRLTRFLHKRGFGDDVSVGLFPTIARYLVLLGGLVAALQAVGIDLSTLFAAGAVFAVGIGLAMQNVAQNFVSGVILLVERSIKPGDVLEVDETVVRVKKIGIRSTVARTRNDEELIIPNSSLVQDTVRNYTMSDASYMLGADVGVSYGSDLKKVRQVLFDTAQAFERSDHTKVPRILLREFGNSSVNFTAFVWIDDPWEARRTLSDLNEAIWWALKQAGITIAFPQLDLHLDKPVEESLRPAAPASPA